MTERIKQLALLAGLEWKKQQPHYTNTDNPIDFPESANRDLEKFAQLIVAECINKIETHQIPVGNSAAGEMACEWTYSALKEIRDEIREHFFGIEE